MKHEAAITFVIRLVAVACLAYAWVMAAGWFGVDPGNFDAWVAAGLAIGFVSFLPAAIVAAKAA